MNGQPSNIFRSPRGLRQDDSFSPTIFVIAMEGLTTLLDYAETVGKIKALGKRECAVSHLFFANNVMIFSRALLHFVKQFEEVLLSFSKASSLQMNLAKSKIIFSKGVPTRVKNSSNFKEGSLPVKYLGVPLH